MPFPDSSRVIYEKNPLSQVICQLRFPTILRIDSQLPVEFQEQIRNEYPILEEKVENPLNIPNMPAEIAQLIPETSRKPAFDFISADEEWIVSLTSSFLALTARNYVRWESFEEHLRAPFNALVEEYSPTFFTRIGLRYQNVIRKSTLNIDEQVPWSELLKPQIAGEMVSAEIESSIRERSSNVLVDLVENLGQVRIRHGLARIQDTDEIGYLIDNDFFTERRTDHGGTFSTLEQFHNRSGRLFRWCITERLHEAMEPQPIS